MQSGRLELEKAVALERSALAALRCYDKGEIKLNEAIKEVREYWTLIHSELAKVNPSKANKEIEILTQRIPPARTNRGKGVTAVFVSQLVLRLQSFVKQSQ